MAPALELDMRSIPVLPALAAPVAAQESLAGRTHSFLAPSGETVGRGEATLQVHALSAWNQLLYGVTDRVEISVSSPIIPAFGSFGVRVGLTPRESPMRIVLG